MLSRRDWIRSTALCTLTAAGATTPAPAARGGAGQNRNARSAAGNSGRPGAEAIDIGSRRELFVDRYLIHRLDDARLVLHHPRDEGPVIRFDNPWEFPFAGCPTVIKDGAKYRLFYRGMSGPGDGTNVECTCYAESDGSSTANR